MEVFKMSYENDNVEGCDCDIFLSRKPSFKEERLNVLDITIDKYMERRDSKFDKAILRRRTLIKNTMYRLQAEIKVEEELEDSLNSNNEFNTSWELEEFQDNLDAFEANIDRMMQCGIYGSNDSQGDSDRSSSCKRSFEEIEVEDVLSEFRLPGLLGSIDDELNFEPLSKRFKNAEGDS